ncbi:NYN domain-containing protein [Rhizobiales bacterium TNE-4]|nr:NYN domain-containing protein [Rhizobiales bacterium TNE-4]MBV1828790.1 NYN domain-containing protein [Rhizobiales bacterium TNE-4]
MSDQERVAVFIDGANLYAAARSLEFDIDYRKMLAEMKSWGRLLRVFYYTAVVEDDEYNSIRPLLDWLDYNGFTVVTKNAKSYVDDSGRRKIKGNMDIELAVDALETAPHIDHAVIFSGDGDFTRVVQAMQRKGVRVSVVSTLATKPPMIADELRRQCDEFIDLTLLMDKIGRDPEVRAERIRKRAEAVADAD